MPKSETNKTYRHGLLDAADLLNLTSQEIRLAAGEVSVSEMRLLKALLCWRRRVITEMANAKN